MAIQSKLDLRSPGRKLHVGVILMGGETEILDVAPIDLVNAMTSKFTKDFPDDVFSAEAKKQSIDVEFHWVNETGNPAELSAGIKLLPTDTFETCPRLDVALMGAHSFSYQPNEVELAYIRKVYGECDHFLTICGGSMAPLQAGLLSGQTATAPRIILDMLRQQAPDVNWTEKRWQKSEDGKLWTSGALLNGTDMMRAWAEENLVGDEQSLASVALKVGGWPGRNVDYKDEL